MKHQLSGIIGQRETAVIYTVVDEITAKQPDQYGLQLMPPTAVPQHLVYHEKVSGFGGLLSERVLGEEGSTGSASSSETIEFSGGAYQEAKRFTERDLVTLRRLGSLGDRGVTGLTGGALDMMSRAGMDLQKKLMNRLNKLAWDTLFTGQYTYLGQTKANFNVPSQNQIHTATDWSATTTSTPLKDLYQIQVQNPVVMKYAVKEWVINPITHAAILNSPEVRSLLVNHAGAMGDVNKCREILYPGLAPFKVVMDTYQDQTTAADGTIINGVTTYFVPDFKILMVPDFSGTLYGLFGEIQMTYNMNDPAATVESPAMGIYTFVDEAGLLRRRAPHVEIVTGFNGGPNLLRSNDVVTILCQP